MFQNSFISLFRYVIGWCGGCSDDDDDDDDDDLMLKIVMMMMMMMMMIQLYTIVDRWRLHNAFF